MIVCVNSEQAKRLKASDVIMAHERGVNIVVEGDELPADVRTYELPSGEQIVYTEESIGQDENGNEIYVPVEYGN